MKTDGFDEFINGRFGKALSERNFDKASKELLLNKEGSGPSKYLNDVGQRAKANSKLLKSLGEQYVSSVATQNMSEELSDSFVPLPVKSSESVNPQSEKQTDKKKRLPDVPSEGFTGFNIPT